MTYFDNVYDQYLYTITRGVEALMFDNAIEKLLELKESTAILDKSIEKLMTDPEIDLQVKNMFRIPKEIFDNVLNNWIARHVN